MTVEVISVGTELLLGNITNTNAQFLAEQCALLGWSMLYQTVVGDNEERLAKSFETALERSDVVLLTGGLGPTEDDITKEVCAKVMGMPLESNECVKAQIQKFFENSVYKVIPDSNWKQALVPKGAKVLENHNGTAPGLIMERNGKTAVLLPGPFDEMYPLFERQVAPYLQQQQPGAIRSRMIKTCGMGESRVEREIIDLISQQNNPTIATYAKTGEVHICVTAQAENEEMAYHLIDPVAGEIIARLKDSVYTIKQEVTLEMAVVEMLGTYGLTVSTAESCTGGMLAARMINVPGASEVFKQGYVTYSNQAKRKALGVNKATLEKYGAVSSQTAKEMASGGVLAAASDICVAITGIAGPDGGTAEKPVGLVYVSCYMDGRVSVERCQFKGDRKKIREQTVVWALDLLRRSILSNYKS